jgi:tetratricopeptide (TPR) repeat protein
MTFKPTGPPNPALEPLRRELRRCPDDPEIQYRLAVILMNSAQLKLPTRKHKRRARELLSLSIEHRSNFAPAHALLALVQLDLDEIDAAIKSLRRALELVPNDEIYQDFLLETLDHAGRTAALRTFLRKVAELRKIDFDGLRAELKRAKLPTDPSTIRRYTFPAGEQHFDSKLLDSVDAIERRYCKHITSDHELLQQARQSIAIDAKRVPENLRQTIPLVKRWGLSDDALRGVVIDQASARDRAGFRKALTLQQRRQINDWIDSFADAATMSNEAAHFMYLLEAYEEL